MYELDDYGRRIVKAAQGEVIAKWDMWQIDRDIVELKAQLRRKLVLRKKMLNALRERNLADQKIQKLNEQLGIVS